MEYGNLHYMAVLSMFSLSQTTLSEAHSSYGNCSDAI